ncbi:MAG: phosphatase [Clostridiales bacterium]|nr:phosphatase [Clostridiales bacterium]
MNYVLDTHTHTLVSGHAYSTIREMAKSASEKGLQLLGITEHGPKMPGSCNEIYFKNLKMVEREYYGVELLMGCELNILDFDGTVDLSDSILKNMDLAIASMHIPCMKRGSREEYTEAYLKVMKNPYVDIIGHPDDSRFPMDYEAFVQGAKEYGKIIELNNHSLDPRATRVGGRENDIQLLNLCARYGVPVVVGSDAHVDTQVGNHQNAYELLEVCEFPQELVLNQSVQLLKKYINHHKL